MAEITDELKQLKATVATHVEDMAEAKATHAKDMVELKATVATHAEDMAEAKVTHAEDMAELKAMLRALSSVKEIRKP